MTISGTRNR